MIGIKIARNIRIIRANPKNPFGSLSFLQLGLFNLLHVCLAADALIDKVLSSV